MRAALLLLGVASLARAQAPSGDRAIQSDAGVREVAFSVDGGRLAGVCLDGKVRLWDARSGALQRTVAWEEGDGAATLPQPGLLAAVGKDGSLKSWELASGERVQRLAGPLPRVADLAFSPDRKLVAGSSRVPGNGSEETVRLWEASGRERFAVPNGLGGTSAMAFSPDGGTLVAASFDTNLRVWSARNGELLRTIDELLVAQFTLAFSPDGRMVVTGGFSELTSRHPVQILIWDVASGKVLRSIAAARRVSSAAFSPDGSLVATADSEKTVSLWKVPVTEPRP